MMTILGRNKVDEQGELDAVHLYKAKIYYSYKNVDETRIYYFLFDDMDLNDAAQLISDYLDHLMIGGRWYILKSLKRINKPIFTNLEEFGVNDEQ